MDRLTEWDEHGNPYLWRGVQMMKSRYNRLLAEALDRLAEYEDTGLSPEEVLDLRLTSDDMDYAARCGSCLWFSTSGYLLADEDMPELQCGYCRFWRHDVQALDFCSKYGARR